MSPSPDQPEGQPPAGFEGSAGAPVADSPPLSAADGLALIESQRRRAESALDVDPRILLGAWGTSWLTGFLLLWASSPARVEPLLSLPWWFARALFGALLVAAAVVSAVHIARATAGVRGVSARSGAMYGWAWLLGFGGLASIMAALDRFVPSPDSQALLWPALSGLVVALLYLAGGALWQDWVQYALGGWILLVSAVGAWAGLPGNYLVMALAGGGGFLLVAAGYAVVRARAPRERPAA